jgi:hypothetical protein
MLIPLSTFIEVFIITLNLSDNPRPIGENGLVAFHLESLRRALAMTRRLERSTSGFRRIPKANFTLVTAKSATPVPNRIRQKVV